MPKPSNPIIAIKKLLPARKTIVVLIASNIATAGLVFYLINDVNHSQQKDLNLHGGNRQASVVKLKQCDPGSNQAECRLVKWKPYKDPVPIRHMGFSIVSLPPPPPSSSSPAKIVNNQPTLSCPVHEWHSRWNTQVSLRASKAPRDKPYNRNLFAHWSDLDGDGINTRHDLLASTAIDPTSIRYAKNGKSVLHGKWYDPYTDLTFTNPRALDIDHVVPLKYAWDHGAWQWTAQKREKFANDEATNLLAVRAKENRQKSAAGPLEWLPPNKKWQCQYVLRFRRVSLLYGLKFTPIEDQELRSLQACLCGQ